VGRTCREIIRMSEGARYAPSGPGAEAAIEVEMDGPAGPVFLRMPASTFAKVYGTIGDSRDRLFGVFINKKADIWPKLWKKVPGLSAGEVYTVTPEDLA
jgi:hypothetical protein